MNFYKGRFRRGKRISRLKRAYADTTSRVSTIVQSKMGLNQKEKDFFGYELLSTKIGHKDAIREIHSSSNGTFASASFDRKVKVWNKNMNNPILTYSGHTGAVNTVRLLEQVNSHLLQANKQEKSKHASLRKQAKFTSNLTCKI